jgi:hypothetical protein
MVKPQVVGTIRYMEWLILTDRVQPSFMTGVQYCLFTPEHTVATQRFYRKTLGVATGRFRQRASGGQRR